METIKRIKIEEKLLSSLNLNVVELDVKNEEEYFDFLTDDLTELLKDKLKTLKWGFDKSLKVYYSLGYSQGDGFMFEGFIKTKNAVFSVKHSGHYYHYNSKNIELINLIVGKKEVYPDEFNEQQYKKVNQLENEFNENYICLCKDMENIGYKIIEERNEENILRIGFNDFCENNDLNEDELFNFDYLTEEKKGYVKVCSSGNTSIKGLWIEDKKIKITHSLKAIAEIITTEEKNFI